MSKVIWKPVNNYENYSVSNNGDIKNNSTQRILKYYIRNGYKSVSLSKNNCKKTYNIHCIVAEHFLTKPIDKGYVVNHINENKLDNHITNLEYITHRENILHSATPYRNRNTDNVNIDDYTDIPNYTNYKISKSGQVYSKKIKRLCCVVILPSGYYKIKLKSDIGIYKDLYIHVLVAMTYLNYIPIPRKYVINHIDGIKGNNNLENLEIITMKDNTKHSIKLNYNKLYRKPVYYINSDNDKVSFISAKQASQITGIDNSSILKSCKHENKKAGNIKWYYV
jgi:hypothetical protein